MGSWETLENNDGGGLGKIIVRRELWGWRNQDSGEMCKTRSQRVSWGVGELWKFGEEWCGGMGKNHREEGIMGKENYQPSNTWWGRSKMGSASASWGVKNSGHWIHVGSGEKVSEENPILMSFMGSWRSLEKNDVREWRRLPPRADHRGWKRFPQLNTCWECGKSVRRNCDGQAGEEMIFERCFKLELNEFHGELEIFGEKRCWRMEKITTKGRSSWVKEIPAYQYILRVWKSVWRTLWWPEGGRNGWGWSPKSDFAACT